MTDVWFRGEGVGVPTAKIGGVDHDLSDGMYLTNDIEVAKTYAREHPEQVEAFLKGIAEGALYLKQGQNDPAKRARSLQIVADRLKVAEDVVAPELDKIAELARIDLAPDMPSLTEYRAMVARLTPGVEQIPLEDVIDVSFINKLLREGFFDRIKAGS